MDPAIGNEREEGRGGGGALTVLGDDLLEGGERGGVNVLVHVLHVQGRGLDALDLPKDDSAHDDRVALQVEELDAREVRGSLLDGDDLKLDAAGVEAEEAGLLYDCRELSPRQNQGRFLLVHRLATAEPHPRADATQAARQESGAAETRLLLWRIFSQHDLGRHDFGAVHHLRGSRHENIAAVRIAVAYDDRRRKARSFVDLAKGKRGRVW